MSDVTLQDWPEGVKLRITYRHDKEGPRAITSYAGEWRFFEPVSVKIEPHPEGFYVPARDYDRQAAEIARLRAAINDALLEPWSDGQLSGTWHQEPIGPNESPEDAVKRLVSVRAQWEVYKNNCENPVIAELRADLATARREGMGMPSEFLEWMKREMPSGTNIQNPDWWAERIWRAAIRAAAKEGKP